MRSLENTNPSLWAQTRNKRFQRSWRWDQDSLLRSESGLGEIGYHGTRVCLQCVERRAARCARFRGNGHQRGGNPEQLGDPGPEGHHRQENGFLDCCSSIPDLVCFKLPLFAPSASRGEIEGVIVDSGA